MNTLMLHKKVCLSVLFFWASFMLHAQTALPVLDFSQYENRVQQNNDTLYVVNFWATWCKPCVEELPFFKKAEITFAQHPVKIILVSQDAKNRTAQVGDFMKKNNYSAECFLLSAGNPNVWIDKIDTSWSGTIPMTVIYKNGKKIYFHEGDYETYDDLEKIIHSKL